MNIKAQRRERVGDHVLHIAEYGGEWECWLNEVSDYDGLCLAIGPTEDAVLAEAVRVLEALTERLQGPKPEARRP